MPELLVKLWPGKSEQQKKQLGHGTRRQRIVPRSQKRGSIEGAVRALRQTRVILIGI